MGQAKYTSEREGSAKHFRRSSLRRVSSRDVIFARVPVDAAVAEIREYSQFGRLAYVNPDPSFKCFLKLLPLTSFIF